MDRKHRGRTRYYGACYQIRRALAHPLGNEINIKTMNPQQTKIHDVLVTYMDKRCTLNPQIPPDVSCAEAVSFLLQQLGIDDGTGGIAGTESLLEWVLTQPQLFQQIDAPEESALLISATGTGNGLVEGHTGFFGVFNLQYPNDWGIVSNNSQTGLLGEQWSWSAWTKNYTQLGGIVPRMFRILS